MCTSSARSRALRNARGVHQVPQFMLEEPEALAAVLGDGARGGLVEAMIRHPEVIGADRRARFDRQLADRLTDIAIRVHHLGHGQSLEQQVMPMRGRAPANLGV
jgi:hypothetical protein